MAAPARETGDDPIIAVATAPGRGGIGVVRVSGRSIDWIAAGLLGRVPPAREATLLPFKFHDAVIDRGIAVFFKAPASYTGEDVLELQGHGGPVVLQSIVTACLELARETGHRLRIAEPGEFTRRAFLNDKLDLAQAEAVADLIDAQTEAAARSAVASLDGRFSSTIHALVDGVLALRLLVEATLDFPEEEIEFLQGGDALGKLDRLQAQLAGVLAQARQGALLRDGVRIVLAGLPNAGKSSLLNALAGEEAAIVTPVAGTTRDTVERRIAIEGVPVIVIDTAGLRDTDDVVEAIGIERSWKAVQGADAVIHLHDSTATDVAGDLALAAQLAERVPPRVPVLQVFNKRDLVPATGRTASDVMAVSALTHEGLDELRQALRAATGIEARSDDVFIARERHLEALRIAQSHLAAAASNARAGDAISDARLDLFAEELRLAQQALGSITGEVTSDALLGAIFSRFCIGK
ncbi:tRNA uridine-5-carboxymethylaminomethyl(34) synthesis GTPase MnmE [soil metagenome]